GEIWDDLAREESAADKRAAAPHWREQLPPTPHTRSRKHRSRWQSNAFADKGAYYASGLLCIAAVYEPERRFWRRDSERKNDKGWCSATREHPAPCFWAQIAHCEAREVSAHVARGPGNRQSA